MTASEVKCWHHFLLLYIKVQYLVVSIKANITANQFILFSTGVMYLICHVTFSV